MPDNIVLITVDCFRYDRCGFAGHHRNTTPFLDELCGESLVFDRAFSTGPFTTESFPGIIAGQHSYNGCYFDSPAWKAIPEGAETIGTHLQEQGFDTVAVLSNPNLSRQRNFDTGFDTFVNFQTDEVGESGDDEQGEDQVTISEFAQKIKDRLRGYDSMWTPYTIPYVAYRYQQYRGKWPTNRAEAILDRFLEEIECAEGPFFAWTHLMDLHAPIFPDVGDSSALRNIVRDTERVISTEPDGYPSLYDDALRYVDQQIRSFFEELDDICDLENTTVIITGDHGEAFHDRNNVFGHPRHHNYDELLHVPLIVREPDSDGKRHNYAVSLAWLHELITDSLGVEEAQLPAGSGSNSLLDGQEPTEYVVSDTIDSQGHTIAVRDNEFKYLRHEVDPDRDSSYDFATTERLVRYASDRGERISLDLEHGTELQETATSLITDPNDLQQVDGDFTGAVEDRLSDLGYKM